MVFLAIFKKKVAIVRFWCAKCNEGRGQNTLRLCRIFFCCLPIDVFASYSVPWSPFSQGQKRRRTKIPRFFVRNFVPNLAMKNALNLVRMFGGFFVLCFLEMETTEIHQEPPQFCNGKSSGRLLPSSHRYPKDPAVLKILRDGKFTMRSKFTIAQ